MGRLKVLMWAPDWDNRWLPYFKDELSSQYDLTFASTVKLGELIELSKGKDLFLSMWADGILNLWAVKFPGVPIISFMRRYEAFFPFVLDNVLFDRVDALIFVNEAVRKAFESLCKRQPKRKYTIYNAVDLDAFPLLKSEDTKPREIAYVCKHSYIMNFPMATQILSLLPKDYRIHHIGAKNERGLLEFKFYTMALGVADRWIWHDPIPAKDMTEWYRDKDFILSTSMNEGNPNNVIEGMALGLKPIVHCWPGAHDQFPLDNIFDCPEEATEIIMEPDYHPAMYRKWVQDNYSLDNIKEIHRVIEDVCG